MMRLSAVALVLSALLPATGCYDFVEPELAEAGAPAVLQGVVNVTEQNRLVVQMLLVPGFDSDALPREFVGGDTLIVYGFKLTPTAVRPNGTREYAFNRLIEDRDLLAEPVTLTAPSLNTRAPRPSVSWSVALPLERNDTLRVGNGGDVVLKLRPPGEVTPVPGSRQWVVDLEGDRNFRISANGAAPAEIRIPSYWLPPSTDGPVIAILTQFFNIAHRPEPGDYILSLSADVRARWHVKQQE